jgi:diamine N-acetyltransferase
MGALTMITLQKVTKENLDDVLSLTVDKSQKTFVSSNAESLAQAYVYSETAYPFAVYADETVVGFIMMGYYEVKRYYTLWEFMIDHKYQNKGYGRQALKLGLNFVKEKFGPVDIYTGVTPGNTIAKRLYESVGFESTGLVELGMEEMRLKSGVNYDTDI